MPRRIGQSVVCHDAVGIELPLADTVEIRSRNTPTDWVRVPNPSRVAADVDDARLVPVCRPSPALTMSPHPTEIN